MDNKREKKEGLTPEQVSLQRYFGFLHAKINNLGDLNPRKIFEQQKAGWDLDYSKDLEAIISDFVNIYGYIYENGTPSKTDSLYRGTITSEARALSEGKEIGGILSTSTDKDVAKRFAVPSTGNNGREYAPDNGTLMYIHTTDGVPHVSVEELKEFGATEEECLILPFSKVTSIEPSGNINGIKCYKVVLEKQDLPTLDDSTLEAYKQECISGFGQFMENLQEYQTMANTVEELQSGRGGNPGQIRETTEKMFSLYMPIVSFREKFISMLKGMCRQRELEIDKKNEAIRTPTTEEKAAEDKKMSQVRLERRIEACKADIKRSVKDAVSEYSISLGTLNGVRKSLGLEIPDEQGTPAQMIELRNQIIKAMSGHDKGDLEAKLEKYDTLGAELLPDLVEEFKEISEADIKRALSEKVKTLVFSSIAGKLYEEKKDVEAQKDTLIQRLFGNNKLKQARLENIDARLDLENIALQSSNPQNSVRLMLQQMYDCAYKYHGGQLPPEMVELEAAIRQNFGNLPRQEDLIAKAVGKQKSGLPDVIKKEPKLFEFGKRKEEIDRITAETDGILAEVEKYNSNQTQNGFRVGITTRTPGHAAQRLCQAFEDIYSRVTADNTMEQGRTDDELTM